MRSRLLLTLAGSPYRLSVTSPITETVSKKLSMRIGGTPTKQLVLRSSGDTFAVSGGRD